MSQSCETKTKKHTITQTHTRVCAQRERATRATTVALAVRDETECLAAVNRKSSLC